MLVLLFWKDREIKEGDVVKRTGQIVEVPVGKGLWEESLMALETQYGKGPLKNVKKQRVEIKAPGIMPRKSVHEPMQTGIKAIG